MTLQAVKGGAQENDTSCIYPFCEKRLPIAVCECNLPQHFLAEKLFYFVVHTFYSGKFFHFVPVKIR